MIEKKFRLEDKKNENFEIFLYVKYIRIVFLRKFFFLYYICILFNIKLFFFFRVVEKDKIIQGLQSDIEVQKKEVFKFLEQVEIQKKKNNVSVFQVYVYIMYIRKVCSM